MDLHRFHPLSTVTLLVWVAAAALPFHSFGLQFSPRALLGTLLLSSAFGVLSAGHFLAPMLARDHGALVMANLPLLLAWSMAVTAMWYLKPGLLGAAVLGAILSALAAMLVLALVPGKNGRSDAV